MWIVQIALRRPYTFIVMAIAITLLGGWSALRTPTDILPTIRIPVIAAVWNYTGLQPADMADRVVGNSERGAPTLVNDIEHSESQSLTGIGVVKYYFQPGVNADLAFAQITGASQTQLRNLPPGAQPPVLLNYNASTVPILQLALDSPSIPDGQLFDLATNVVRPMVQTIGGAASPFPYGGKQRVVQVDLDPNALRARSLAGNDVVAAIGSQNLFVPAGSEKISDIEYHISLNASPRDISELNDLPLRTDNGIVTYVRDVAHVHDGSSPQTNVVRVDGRHSVLMTILKTGSASTLDVVRQVREMLPRALRQLPDGVNITPLNDQSLFVRAAVNGVIREGVLAALLTGLMILLILGSWRSTVIITLTIPLPILASVACLSALGETINIMTLGGLALAVGILVDNATVTIENINWHLEHGKDVEQAILDGAEQIALPALVSTLAICIVFVPMFMLAGVSRYLFVPLAEAVVFAMLASYLLSRTLVPTLAMYWLRPHAPGGAAAANALHALQLRVERGFEALRQGYHELLAAALQHARGFMAAFIVMAGAGFLLLPFLGQDFFPSVDAGQVRLHLRARSGTRIEQTSALCDQVEATIRRVIPAGELVSLVDNIGVPYSGLNLAYSTSAPIGTGDADILIELKPGHHAPTEGYVRTLRARLGEQFPGVGFAFLPSDILTQILNSGLPSPLDVAVIGRDAEGNRAFANRLASRLRAIPGTVDVRVHQANDYPQVNVDVNRSKAALLGLTQANVAGNILVSLAGSSQSSPSFWLDPRSRVQYSVVTQAEQWRLNSLQDLGLIQVGAGNGSPPQLLANLATLSRGVGAGVVSHYDAKPVFDVYGSVEGIDLGRVATGLKAVVHELEPQLPRGSEIMVRGQIDTMQSSLRGLASGMVGAVILVYLLMVVNFQSWIDPLVIITALPAALAGIVWMLFTSHTTLSVPALIGAIMCIGVATANSILVVSFARERMNAGLSPHDAALEAGFVRFRPVLMTALAMVIGMVPMALGMGEGSEQNAPLGRAAIGGLLFATFATLLFVPVVFSTVHGWLAARRHGPAQPLPGSH
jgi:multidrug efflux pump subunit AcrB